LRLPLPFKNVNEVNTAFLKETYSIFLPKGMKYSIKKDDCDLNASYGGERNKNHAGG
jgi:hypothetical protein